MRSKPKAGKLQKYVAIIGRQVVGEESSFQKLSEKVRPTYGYGAIFMPEVTREYPPVSRLRSPRSVAVANST